MNWFFNGENIVIFQQIMSSWITAATRMPPLGVLNEHFINIHFLAKDLEEQRRIALENDFA